MQPVDWGIFSSKDNCSIEDSCLRSCCRFHGRISESTAIESVKYFAKAIISIFGPEYLRSPNSNDIELLLALNKTRGFPGMLGSIDCMHWKWKNCPTAWKGSHNDINVLERSHVFSELTQGRASIVNYSINGHNYTVRYYLADGVYPS
ncbi:uncharacterized protein LOC119987891 [Tripterygium wilfordii]|uniref:uncharacterized protein LOC119987891 n=1 Tax=Tripterygium wilfordii TaxID=458696 RepID=UPI0018F7FC6E|nr:uncharacterized protein LOC119987891 [Tripterygium wilfordii]